MKIEEPNSPALPDVPSTNDRKDSAWWRQFLEHFAIRLTLIVVILFFVIWYLVNEANKQPHDIPTLVQKLQELFH